MGGQTVDLSELPAYYRRRQPWSERFGFSGGPVLVYVFKDDDDRSTVTCWLGGLLLAALVVAVVILIGWLLPSWTRLDQAGVTIRVGLLHRRVAWSDVAAVQRGSRGRDRGQAVVVLMSGRRRALPGVPTGAAKDLNARLPV